MKGGGKEGRGARWQGEGGVCHESPFPVGECEEGRREMGQMPERRERQGGKGEE